MMMKCDVWRYAKTGGFWLTYAVLMGFNLIVITGFGIDLYYEVVDPQYWREHYTMYPYVDVELPISFAYKLKMFLLILFLVGIVALGNYRLHKKKRGGLLILGFLIYVAIGSFVYIEILGLGAWGPGHDFP